MKLIRLPLSSAAMDAATHVRRRASAPGRAFQRLSPLVLTFIFLALAVGQAAAQGCFTPSDMDAATKSSLESAARQDFQAAQQGGAALLSQADFNVSDIISANQDLFAGTVATRSVYLLDNSQPSGQRAQFFCGIYNSPKRVAFVFNGLPAGRYGIVIQDVSGKTPGTVSWVLRQSGAQWRVGGLIPKPGELAGHDGNWYLNQARAYHAKGQNHNAWLFYSIALDLMQPLGALHTPPMDKLYDEAQQTLPPDLPARGRAADITLNGRAFHLTEVFATPVGHNLDLVVKYQEPDVSDTSKTYQDNMAVMRGLTTKYPELREAFAGIVARAVTPGGQEYGTLLAMKDVK